MPVRSDMEGVNGFALTMENVFQDHSSYKVLEILQEPASNFIFFQFYFLVVRISFIPLTAIRNNFPRIKSSIIGNVVHVTFKKRQFIFQRNE